MALVDELKKGQRVDVKIRNLYLFLLRDGDYSSHLSDIVLLKSSQQEP